MKLLVLAQVPPPVHGQSVMVDTLVRGLPAHGVEVRHVNLRLSRDAADIGRWRWGKLATVLDACLHAIADRFAHGCDTLYYVPAPPRRAALYRDWAVLLLCRPFFRRLVLHWQAGGLGAWLRADATVLERAITQRLLGRADLAIVLGESLRADAAELRPLRTKVIPNGIVDPVPAPRQPRHKRPQTALFLGACVEDKGVLDAIEAVRLANAAATSPRWRLVLAGPVPNPRFGAILAARMRSSPGTVQHAGFVVGEAKQRLLADADALVFPTYYAAETQGLVVAEALAHDVPVVVTRWRAVAEHLPAGYPHVVEPRRPDQVARCLEQIAAAPFPVGTLRRFFEQRLTADAHCRAMADAIRSA